MIRRTMRSVLSIPSHSTRRGTSSRSTERTEGLNIDFEGISTPQVSLYDHLCRGNDRMDVFVDVLSSLYYRDWERLKNHKATPHVQVIDLDVDEETPCMRNRRPITPRRRCRNRVPSWVILSGPRSHNSRHSNQRQSQ